MGYYSYQSIKAKKDKRKYQKKSSRTLPTSLARLTYKDIYRFRIEKETILDPLTSDSKTGEAESHAQTESISPIDMAVAVVLKEKTGRFRYGENGKIIHLYRKVSYRLDDLTKVHLFQLARAMSLKNINSLTSKEYVRRAFAIRYRAYERYADANPKFKLKRFEDYVSNIDKETELSNTKQEVSAAEKKTKEHQSLEVAILGDVGIFDQSRKRPREDPFDATSSQEDDDWVDQTSDEEEVDGDMDTSKDAFINVTDKSVQVNGLHSETGLGFECKDESTYHKMGLVGAFISADKRVQRILQMAEVSKTILAQARDLEQLDFPPDIIQRMRTYADQAMRAVLSMPTAMKLEDHKDEPFIRTKDNYIIL